MPILMTRTEALNAATARLAGVSETPRLDAEMLLAHAHGITREAMLLGDYPVLPGFDALVDRRSKHEPVAYIMGKCDFWTLTLTVTPDVLIPRADSETLIEAAIDHFGAGGPATILDLGTGSGALLLAALDHWPDATGVGIDASDVAVQVASDNARRLGLRDRTTIRLGDWVGTGQAFDLILCNPPYVATGDSLPPSVYDFEPASALYAGGDGLDDYRMIAPVLGGQMTPGGVVCIEIGWTQADAVCALFAAEGLNVAVRKDLAGRDRCVIVTQ